MTRFSFLSGTDASVAAVFSSHARENPHKTFVSFQGRDVGYGELEALANRLAHGLRDELGLGRGDRVLVYLSAAVEYFAVMLAIHRVGGVYVPCSTLYSAEEVAHQVAHCKCRAVFVDAPNLPNLRAALVMVPDPPTVLTDLNALVAGRPATPPPSAGEITPDDLAMVMYTSGTTARPKGVMFSFGNLRTAADSAVKHFRWTSRDRFLHQFPLYHANGGLFGVLPAMLTGATIVLTDKFSASEFGQRLHDWRITFTSVNATHLKMVMNNPDTKFDRVHECTRMMLGLTAEPEDILAFERRFATRLVPTYGLTEALGLVVIGDPVGPRRLGSAGRVVRGYSLRLLDKNGVEVGYDQPGHAQVFSHQEHGLTLGYLDDPEQTTRVYGDGWLSTGDILKVDAAGYVHSWTGNET